MKNLPLKIICFTIIILGLIAYWNYLNRPSEDISSTLRKNIKNGINNQIAYHFKYNEFAKSTEELIEYNMYNPDLPYIWHLVSADKDKFRIVSLRLGHPVLLEAIVEWNRSEFEKDVDHRGLIKENTYELLSEKGGGVTIKINRDANEDEIIFIKSQKKGWLR
jgi:hypothetical protein